jgi:translation elongation factor EF-Tu-like GTPase
LADGTINIEFVAIGFNPGSFLRSEMLRLLAKMYLQTPEENGASTDGFSGMRPSFGFDRELITSEIHAVSGSDSVFPRGAWSLVEIRLPYGEVFEDIIHAGMPFGINVGGWRVGRGVVEEILEISRDPRHQYILDEIQSKKKAGQ